MTDEPCELPDQRRMLAENRVRLEAILRRIDTRGMRRLARDPEEREWLRERFGESLDGIIEDEAVGAAALAYYQRRYQRP